MVQFNFARMEVNCKIVYCGPGLSGKTTNLEIIHRNSPKESRGEMTSIATEGDRTLFFDFLPLELGTVRGMRTNSLLVHYVEWHRDEGPETDPGKPAKRRVQSATAGGRVRYRSQKKSSFVSSGTGLRGALSVPAHASPSRPATSASRSVSSPSQYARDPKWGNAAGNADG